MQGGWKRLFRIADLVVQLESDSDACREGMGKFIQLYEPVHGLTADLMFHVRTCDGKYVFSSSAHNQQEQILWQSSDSREITAALEIHLYSQAIQMLAPELVSIHASLLGVGNQAVVFAGDSGSGKSSICTAGLLSGATYLSDEFALIGEDGSGYPFPRPMQWEHATHPAFERDDMLTSGYLTEGVFVFPDTEGHLAECHLWYPVQVQHVALPIESVVFQRYSADTYGVHCVEIPRHEAMIELPKHLHLQQGMAHDLPMLNKRLSASCKFYRLEFSDVHQAWQQLAKELAKHE